MLDDNGRDALFRVLVSGDPEVVTRLRLSAAEAARVCQVTPRQLIYWTRKGLVKPSADDAHSYDVVALERVVRIRRELENGRSLEKAAQAVDREMALLAADAEHLATLDPGGLEAELAARLERLEARIGSLRRSLPAAVGLGRLRHAVARLASLEAKGSLGAGSDAEKAKVVALRLGRAVDELEQLLREVPADS